MKSSCVHLGLPKTATASLQNLLFARHPEVTPLGKFSDAQWATPLVEEFVAELARSRRQQAAPAGLQLRREIVQPALDAGKVPVLSKEGLSSGREDYHPIRARRLREVLSPCKVLIFLRNPRALIPSLYLQKLAAYNLRWEALSTRLQSALGAPPCFPTLDEWMHLVGTQLRAGPLTCLSYANLIQAYSEVFEAKNVGVFLFEDLCANPQNVLERLSTFLEIDSQQSVRLMQEERLNLSWRQKQIDLLTQICGSPQESARFRQAGEEERARMLGLDLPLSESSPRARIHLSVEVERELRLRTSQGNQWLLETSDLNLKGYDYPLGI